MQQTLSMIWEARAALRQVRGTDLEIDQDLHCALVRQTQVNSQRKYYRCHTVKLTELEQNGPFKRRADASSFSR